MDEEWDDEAFEWVIAWDAVEVGDDDRTLTVRFHAEYDEGELTPVAAARATPDAITVRLSFEPRNGVGGIWLVASPGSARTVELVLEEEVAGRPIVDAWKPPPPPPEIRRRIQVGAEFGPVAAGRQVSIDSIDVYDDCGRVHYRLSPGMRA